MRLLLLLALMTTNAFASDLTVKVTNITKNKGSVRVALFNSAQDFPDNPDGMLDGEIVEASETTLTVTFKNLKADSYAISVFQDINDNGTIDTNFFGIPKEPIGFSNNPRLFGKPKFVNCKFLLKDSMTKTINLKRF